MMTRNELFFSIREQIDAELESLSVSNHAEGIERLKSAVEQNPDYPDLRYRLAQAFRTRGRHADAYRELDLALGINPSFVDALHLKAAILADEGNLESALMTYERVISVRPDDSESHYRSAVIHNRLGDEDSATASALRAVECGKNHMLAHVFLGERFLCRKETDLAISHYTSAYHIRPQEDVCYVLGLLHVTQQRVDEGERFFEEALRLKPNHLNANIRLAIVKVAKGDYERAHGLLKLALGFFPRYPDLHYCLAKICLLMGRRDEAYELMKSALTINPRYAEVRREMGYLYSTKNMNDEAVGELKRSLDINPGDEQAYINLGFIYSNQGERERALEVLEQAVKRFPDSWRLYHSIGIVHLQERSFPKAKLNFLEAVKINPELESIQRSLRIAFQDESLLEDERHRLQLLYGAPGQQSELDYQLGVIHLEFHKERPALGFLQKSLGANHENVVCSFMIATIHANMQNMTQAVRVLEELQCSGMQENIRRMLLGLFLANAGDHQSSIRTYQEVMADNPLLFHALGGLPVCFREQEELDDMLDDYLDYARFHERSGRLFCRVGDIYANKGMLVEAKGHFHHATVLDPNEALAYYALGILMLLRLDLTIAKDFFVKAVEKSPEWPLPHLCLGLILHSQNRGHLAAVSLQRYLNLETIAHWRDKAQKLLESIKATTVPILPDLSKDKLAPPQRQLVPSA